MPSYEAVPEGRRPYVAVLLPKDTFNSMFPPDTTYQNFGLTEGEDDTTALWGDVTCSACSEVTSEIWLQKGDRPNNGICDDCHAEGNGNPRQ